MKLEQKSHRIIGNSAIEDHDSCTDCMWDKSCIEPRFHFLDHCNMLNDMT